MYRTSLLLLCALAAFGIVELIPHVGASSILADDKIKEIDKAIQALPDAEKWAIGKELFNRDWSKYRHDKGDGLGPFYNDVSCVACHSMGGVGGAGSIKSNVDLLSIQSPRPNPFRASQGFNDRVRQFHPSLSATSMSVVLHRFGKDTMGDLDRYAQFRHEALFKSQKKPLSLANPVKIVNRTKIEFAQRNTPALFGAGIIDQIADRDLIELAEKQKNSKLGISGRVPQTATGAIGRFGWRGQTATLEQFVFGACANELGLTVPSHPQPMISTVVIAPSRKAPIPPTKAKHGRPTSMDLSREECRALTRFVGKLPQPIMVNGATLTQSKDALAGEKLFIQVGCAECHVKNVGNAQGIYSDLLLHDMGPQLADSVSAMPEITDSVVRAHSGYFGVSNLRSLVKNITTNINQEWRTPPLWGVRDSAPYMHDGRAATIHLAITMHGGESQNVIKRYRSLKAADRDKLLTFLHMLANPTARPINFEMKNGKQHFPGAGFF